MMSEPEPEMPGLWKLTLSWQMPRSANIEQRQRFLTGTTPRIRKEAEDCI